MNLQPVVRYCRKRDIHPAFGLAFPEEQSIYVRSDLPRSVKGFVRDHELYHLRDRSRWWVWREVKANAYAAWKHPLGLGTTLIMSLKPYRWAYYARRFRKGV